MKMRCFFGLHRWDEWVAPHPQGGTYQVGRDCQCGAKQIEPNMIVLSILRNEIKQLVFEGRRTDLKESGGVQ